LSRFIFSADQVGIHQNWGCFGKEEGVRLLTWQ
jgi:hypothetical protein